MQAAFSLFVVDRVVAALTMATHLGDIRITLETNLTSDLKLGGFGRLKLAMYLEEVFDTDLPDEMVEGFVTVADIVAYMSKVCVSDVKALS